MEIQKWCETPPAQTKGGVIEMHLKVALGLVVALISPSAAGIIKSGTVVMFVYSGDSIALAAHSRVMLVKGNDRFGHEDNQCKLAALGRNAVYAGSGAIQQDDSPTLPDWDARREAIRIAVPLLTDKTIADPAREIAVQWGDWLRGTLNNRLAGELAAIEEMRRNHGQAAGGLFAATTRTGELSAWVVDLRLTNNNSLPILGHATRVDSSTAKPDDPIIGVLGRGAIWDEFTAKKTERAKQESIFWNSEKNKQALADRPILQAIRLVELSIKYLDTRDVGGPVDALDLHKDRTVRWLSQKPKCASSNEGDKKTSSK
jgi:hypothetical protein